MVIESKEAANIVWNDHEDWEPVSDEKIVDQRRWDTVKERVFMHIPTKKYYLFSWDEGSTEQQWHRPYEYENNVNVIEVEEKEVIVKKWISVKP